MHLRLHGVGNEVGNVAGALLWQQGEESSVLSELPASPSANQLSEFVLIYCLWQFAYGCLGNQKQIPAALFISAAMATGTTFLLLLF